MIGETMEYTADLVLVGGRILWVDETLDDLETRHGDCSSDSWTGVVLRPAEQPHHCRVGGDSVRKGSKLESLSPHTGLESLFPAGVLHTERGGQQEDLWSHHRRLQKKPPFPHRVNQYLNHCYPYTLPCNTLITVV